MIWKSAPKEIGPVHGYPPRRAHGAYDCTNMMKKPRMQLAGLVGDFSIMMFGVIALAVIELTTIWKHLNWCERRSRLWLQRGCSWMRWADDIWTCRGWGTRSWTAVASLISCPLSLCLSLIFFLLSPKSHPHPNHLEFIIYWRAVLFLIQE